MQLLTDSRTMRAMDAHTIRELGVEPTEEQILEMAASCARASTLADSSSCGPKWACVS